MVRMMMPTGEEDDDDDVEDDDAVIWYVEEDHDRTILSRKEMCFVRACPLHMQIGMSEETWAPGPWHKLPKRFVPACAVEVDMHMDKKEIYIYIYIYV